MESGSVPRSPDPIAGTRAGAPTDGISSAWRVRPDRGGVPRRPAAGCRTTGLAFDPAERTECADRFAQGAARAAPIHGTGDPDRDARFAAAGAQALADYERRRAPLKPNSRAQPCPHGTDLMGECPVRVIVPIYSKRFIIGPDLS